MITIYAINIQDFKKYKEIASKKTNSSQIIIKPLTQDTPLTELLTPGANITSSESRTYNINNTKELMAVLLYSLALYMLSEAASDFMNNKDSKCLNLCNKYFVYTGKSSKPITQESSNDELITCIIMFLKTMNVNTINLNTPEDIINLYKQLIKQRISKSKYSSEKDFLSSFLKIFEKKTLSVDDIRYIIACNLFVSGFYYILYTTKSLLIDQIYEKIYTFLKNTINNFDDSAVLFGRLMFVYRRNSFCNSSEYIKLSSLEEKAKYQYNIISNLLDELLKIK